MPTHLVRLPRDTTTSQGLERFAFWLRHHSSGEQSPSCGMEWIFARPSPQLVSIEAAFVDLCVRVLVCVFLSVRACERACIRACVRACDSD